jgi:hypothetical protein
VALLNAVGHVLPSGAVPFASGKENIMNSWKGAFVAVLLSGVIIGILNGHLAVWTALGAALGAVMADRERRREIGRSC